MPVKGSDQVASDDGQESLLTRKALEVSLSAPRAPPVGSAHRRLLIGRDPSSVDLWVPTPLPLGRRGHGSVVPLGSRSNQSDDYEAHVWKSHATLRRRLGERLKRSHLHAPLRLPHPHLPAGPETADQITRLLGVLLPLSWQNSCRDSGRFRSIADGLVTASIPLLALSHPFAVRTFLHLSSPEIKTTISYGKHPSQIIDFFQPATNLLSTPRRSIFFVHGGAWGSGYPWMYRLVAKPFLEQGWAVAIIGYRTYPDGKASEQMTDCRAALHQLRKTYPEWMCRHKGGRCTLMGHSSGAHISLLMLVEDAENMMKKSKEGGDILPETLPFDSFVGLSGPFDISHHFDYEAARGVEELSPMKPTCGMTRDGFRHFSPAPRLQKALACFPEDDRLLLTSRVFPRLLLVHGIEDETVPFTATAEAAKIIRACGVLSCEETYVAKTGHQETVMQIMLGGRTRTTVVGWIKHLSKNLQPSSSVGLVGDSKL